MEIIKKHTGLPKIIVNTLASIVLSDLNNIEFENVEKIFCHSLFDDELVKYLYKHKNILKERGLSQIAKYMCDRNFGIGADGLILAEESDIADIKMRIFNKNGTEEEISGNGIRCFARYVFDNKIVNKTNMKVETKAGIKNVKIKMNEEIEVDMGKPIFDDMKNINIKNTYRIPIVINIKLNDNKFIGNYISMGNPHIVIFVNNVDKIDIEKYGRAIENMGCFPNKINVNFVENLGRNTLKIRTWKREVGETYACATGACSAFCIGYYKGICSNYVKVILRGGELKILYNKPNGHIIMNGIAKKVYDGNICI